MRIGIRLHDAYGDTLSQKLKSAKEQGFCCAHIAIGKIEKGFTMQKAPELLTDEYAREFRAACDGCGIEPTLLGCYLNLATPDADELKWTVECYKAHMRFAAMLGKGVMVGTETGAPNKEYRSEPACQTHEALELFIRRVRPLAQYGKELGVTLAIEPVCRHIVSDPARARMVLDAVGLDSLRVIFDPVNLLDRGNVDRRYEIFEDFITLLGDDVRLVHIKDFVLPDMTSVAAGQGEMDYASVLRFAQSRDLPMTLEDTTPQNAENARLYLGNVIR